MVDRASLDDPAAIASADPGGMLEAVAGQGAQLRRGFDLGNQGEAHPGEEPSAIVVCGMGGSGITGDVIRSLLGVRLHVPIVVYKGDALPSFCGPRTLVLAVSYSGGTQETLACYREAVERGCPVVSVSSGGPLQGDASARGTPHLAVPGDAGVPRAALGYLTGALLGWLDRGFGIRLAGEVASAADGLEALAKAWAPAQPASDNEAKDLAGWLLGRTPVIWGSEGLMEAAALRFKNQVNENAKAPSFCSVLPELDHNEIEGWTPGLGEGFAVVGLRHDGEDVRLAERFDATIELVESAGLAVRQIRVEGDGPFDRLFGTLLLSDFASTYLGILRGVDPTPIPTLTGLKARLAR